MTIGVSETYPFIAKAPSCVLSKPCTILLKRAVLSSVISRDCSDLPRPPFGCGSFNVELCSLYNEGIGTTSNTVLAINADKFVGAVDDGESDFCAFARTKVARYCSNNGSSDTKARLGLAGLAVVLLAANHVAAQSPSPEITQPMRGVPADGTHTAVEREEREP